MTTDYEKIQQFKKISPTTSEKDICSLLGIDYEKYKSEKIKQDPSVEQILNIFSDFDKSK